MKRRALVLLAVLVVAGVGLLLLTYEIVGVDVPSFMEDQPVLDFSDAPLRLAAEDSVPLSRPQYLDNAGALENPVPPDDVSLERGSLLFGFHCSVCHGSNGAGDGPVVGFWKEDARQPANLTEARFRQYPAPTLYGIITNGLGTMPPLRENSSERDRWDIINAVHAIEP